jgi:molybdenum cofactor synthesis domain-containing protein
MGSVNVAVLVVSNKILKGLDPDKGKADVEAICQEHEMNLTSYQVIADDREAIREQLTNWCDAGMCQVVLTVGGTGVRPTDWAPEATRDVIDKEIPGIGEAMRAESFKKIRTAMLSRGIAGIRGKTLIVNLPGSLKGARENLQVLLPILEHTVDKITH